jgi:hypothetical protein
VRSDVSLHGGGFGFDRRNPMLHQVADRNDPNEAAAIEHRQMADAPFGHTPQSFINCFRWIGGDDIEWNRGHLKIRVWRTEPSLGDAYTADFVTITNVIDAFGPSGGHPIALHAALMALPRVACVAIVDANGNGVSAYPDWH